jgi:hypothetical protein
MKKYLIPVLLVCGMFVSYGQNARHIPPRVPSTTDSSTNSLPRFDLDFPGGTPKDLVKAIEKASGKPLNAIIPTEDANLKMPPISVKNVIAPELFQALEQVSLQAAMYRTGMNTYQTYKLASGFRTLDTPTENSVWYFFVEKPPGAPISPKICQFYKLAPYLDAGYKVDDITTAVETAWKMLGETNTPNISYHKDTRLLIAVGEPDQLNLIQNALRQLVIPKDKSANESNAEKPKGK